jgi:hypothetical protein
MKKTYSSFGIYTILMFILISSEIIFIHTIKADWVQVSNGLTQLNVNAIINSGSNLYAGTFGDGVGGVFKSTNYGMNWTLCLTLSTGDAVWALDTSGNRIYAGATGGLYTTTNNGTNWNYIFNKWIYSLAANISDVFAGCKYSLNDTVDLYKSTNYGINWSITSLPPCQVNAIAINRNNIYSGVGGGQNLVIGFFVSTNYGLNWTKTINNRTILSLAYDSSYIFAGSDGVYMSTNNGINWVQRGLNNQTIGTLLIYNHLIFAAGGFWVSSDYGDSWVSRTENMPYLVNSLCVSNNFIYAGTDGHGVWRRPLYEIVGLNKTSKQLQISYSLQQNYPNPFNSSTIIKYQLPINSNIKLIIYNVQGKEVNVLVNENKTAGRYEIIWNASTYTSGIYFCRLNAVSNYEGQYFDDIKKIILVK